MNSDHSPDTPTLVTSEEEIPIPWIQRLCDSPFILLLLCSVIFFGFYTGWGIYEIMSLETAPLP